jgi:hypothetical protein
MMEGKGGRVLEALSSVALLELPHDEKQNSGVRIQNSE